ncbi:hypothetical protein DL765_007314 [Monosporascus sp. GIB2]|nr:hypothetical protein DL765_007314 [Monosporascus sp. GIB2]
MVRRGSAAKPASTGWLTELRDIDTALNETSFLEVFKEDLTSSIVAKFVGDVVAQNRQGPEPAAVVHNVAGDGKSLNTGDREFRRQAIRLGLASLGAFLQANVTGPVLEGTDTSDAAFASAYEEAIRYIEEPAANGVSGPKRPIEIFRKLCARSLDTDGVSVYPYVPQIELFGFARFIFTSGKILPVDPPEAWEADSDDTLAGDLSWIRFRVHLWHYKLLTQPSLGPGSLFTKSGRWTDIATLQETIQKSLHDAEASVTRVAENGEGAETPAWPHEHRIQFYLEKANAHLMLGNDKAARRALQSATENSGFVYALSGALGKRTRFQEKNISQLVVLAKSLQITDTDASEQQSSGSAPTALPLDDDTLLEKIDFKNENGIAEERSELPVQLRDIVPDNQPRLKPEDQIILLTEATLKDTFSPSDALTSEEILPFAVRVIHDKASNWQIYTQALLVRSRIELNRSRTLERAVLQMQAVVDQVIVDTQAPALATTSKDAENHNDSSTESEVPSIEIMTTSSRPTGSAPPNKPTSFLPAPKPSESASAQERLRYINALASPPRWHLESELAYAWASVGSLVSATEIFKRLRLWAEVALCLASTATSDGDRDGPGSGGHEKARAIVRWRLFHRTGSRPDSKDGEDDLDDADVDISTLKVSDFRGPERSPAPPNAPRLFCILGDLENDPAHYERAWEISNRRFARAQRSLGELYLRNQEWTKARDAYAAAVTVHRLSSEMWSRLGDIELRLGHFPDAAEAFQRAISTAGSGGEGGEDARTWSNLGSAMLSWYREAAAENKASRERGLKEESGDNVDGSDARRSERATDDKEEEIMPSTARAARLGKQPHRLLNDALEAFKRGATIANSNWRIWDNVVTLAASLIPSPGFDDVILGTRNVLRIRKTEDALDVDILTLLVREVTGRAAGPGDGAGAVYEPPRASLEHKVVDLFENDVVPLLTASSEPWSLVSRLRAWRRDWAGALEAAEKGWRAGVGGSGGGGSSSLAPATVASSSSGGAAAAADWLQDAGAWDAVVQRTSELVAAYENYGDKVESVGSRWKTKARMSVRSVLGKGRESWEGSDGWKVLEGLLEELKG